jgi:hypothetical protein
MNVEIWAEAAQFTEKEYINGIAFAVQPMTSRYCTTETNHREGNCRLVSVCIFRTSNFKEANKAYYICAVAL